MLFNKLNNWLKLSLRLILTTFICGLLFISTAYPAQAVTSSPRDGEANLNRIQNETDKVGKGLDNPPRGLEEVTEKAQQGTNAVQGGADADKMVKPEDTDATTVKEKAANFFENLTN
jgi:hypothetical protein